MITLTDVAYVRSGAADLDTATRFATEIVGLELVAPVDSNVAYLRADHRHHCLALVQGPSGVIASGFTVADSDALEVAETELERAGLAVHRGSEAEARSRRVREFIAFDDPFGNRIELVSQQETVARPVAFSRAAGITEFGHLCLDAPDVHEAYRFWSTRFNARVSDWIGDAACLMRIDPVHHKLAVFRGDEPGLCHMNFQVATIDDLFRNWHFLKQPKCRDRDGPGPPPAVHRDFPVLPGPGGVHLRVLVRRAPDRGRGELGAPHVRPGRARLDRHVARPDHPAHHPASVFQPAARPSAPPRGRARNARAITL